MYLKSVFFTTCSFLCIHVFFKRHFYPNYPRYNVFVKTSTDWWQKDPFFFKMNVICLSFCACIYIYSKQLRHTCVSLCEYRALCNDRELMSVALFFNVLKFQSFFSSVDIQLIKCVIKKNGIHFVGYLIFSPFNLNYSARPQQLYKNKDGLLSCFDNFLLPFFHFQ